MTANVKRVKVRKSSGNSKVASPSISRMLTLLAGLVLLVITLPPFFEFPWLRFWLLPLAAIYLFLLLILPRLWLIALPLATIGLDITPFTGRFTYNELDLLFLVTLSSGLIYNRYRFKVFAPAPAILVLLFYFLVIFIGYSGWQFFALPPGAEMDNPYYTTGYAYKVLKGMVWGLALVPMWGFLLASDKQRTVNALVTGMAAAALLLGIIVLWERGSLGVMLSGSAWYHWVSSLLDLSSSYRVTGIFSDMHTGGEAFDGVVLLLLPATLYGATYGRSTWLRVLGAAAFLTLAYVTLVGFTRATYAAFAIAVVVYALLTYRSRAGTDRTFFLPVAELCTALGAGVIAAVISYRFAGSYGLACYGGLILLAFVARRFRALPPWAGLALTALAVGSIALAVNAHFGSRWVEPSVFWAFLIGVALAASYWCTLRLFDKTLDTSEANRIFILAGTVILPAMLAFALGGYQINDRVSRVGSDLETRESHWQSVIDSAGDGFFNGLLGNGVGSFPVSYIEKHPEKVQEVGSFGIVRERNRDVLRMGGGRDLTLGQRVTVEPYTNYTFNIYLRAAEPARVVVGLCERNLIYASNFMPNCLQTSLKFDATDGAFEKQSLEVNSGKIGERRSLWRWPTVVTIKYDKPDTVLEIDAVDLSADGFNVLRNSSFKQGLDYWFSYNDFSHLPWHVKNTFLQVWFETGWLGLFLFLSLLALLIRTNFRRHAHDSLIPVYTTGVLAICAFGLFGSPLDSARVSWLFYFFLAAGLAQLRVKGKSRSRTAVAARVRH